MSAFGGGEADIAAKSLLLRLGDPKQTPALAEALG
jgi:hypothetical protein